MSYFDHPNLSNSDIKSFKRSLGLLPEEPENLQEIFDLGSYFHAAILEPHVAKELLRTTETITEEDVKMVEKMRKRYWEDQFCREFSMANDFCREKERYEEVVVGPYKVKLRCKADGLRSRVGFFLELKGLGVTTEKAFKDALLRFDYDQALAHYMITADCKFAVIVGISKKDPRKLFKHICKRHDNFFAEGEQKLIESLELIRQYSPEDILVA